MEHKPPADEVRSLIQVNSLLFKADKSANSTSLGWERSSYNNGRYRDLP